METANKTLIGKNGYLFLQNDTHKELKIHGENLCLVDPANLEKYKYARHKFYMVVFPDKSYFCKDYLPDGYNMIYRPGFDIYKNYFGNNILDGMEVLSGNEDIFYKTDTHMNMKGAYMIYLHFINKINSLFHLGINCKHSNLKAIEMQSLCELNNGLGDLTWSQNLGDQVLENTRDIFFLSDDIAQLYTKYEFKQKDPIKLLSLQSKFIIDETDDHVGEKLDWLIISKYILYKRNNCYPRCRILIFYDSFLLSTLSLYLELATEVFMSKSVFNKDLVDHLNPDYVFEFRVERFLI
jgi:hypothetical protein